MKRKKKKKEKKKEIIWKLPSYACSVCHVRSQVAKPCFLLRLMTTYSSVSKQKKSLNNINNYTICPLMVEHSFVSVSFSKCFLI